MVRIAAFLLAVGSAVANAQTGLDFLDPKDVAFVEVKGTVRDEASGGAIPGARVLAIWKGTTYAFHGSNSHCLRIDATRTRADGTFSIATPPKNVYRKGMAQQFVDIRIYADGMEERLEPGAASRKMRIVEDGRSMLAKLAGPKELGLALEVRMAPSREDTPDRLRALEKLGGPPFACETRGDAREIQAYYEALAIEAHARATTRYQRAVADALEADARTVFSDAEERSVARSKIMEQAYRNPEPSDLERRDAEDMTPLMRAAAADNADLVRRLLAAGANPNRTRTVNDLVARDSALTIAMSGRDKGGAAIQALLADPRTDVNLRDRPIDYTPLMKALHGLRPDIVELLLAAGADPNLPAYGGKDSAISVALQAFQTTTGDGQPFPGAVRQLEALLASKRVKLDVILRDTGATPLTQTILFGEADLARRLLEAGADPNAADGLKRTALTAAAEAAIANPRHPRFIDGVRLVAAWPGVDHGALYNGKTAVQMARDAKRPELIAILEGK